MAKSSVSMKLMIDTKAQRVLFAEAGNDCVDLLFSILSLPVASLIDLLKKHGIVGSLANLYESVENLNESYLQPKQSKDALLKPPVSQPYHMSVPLLLPNAPSTERKFYRCNYYYSGHDFVADDPKAVCPSCGSKMASLLNYVAPPGQQASGEGGFLKGLVTYMVMDNLVIKPMSTISCIASLNKFKVKDVSSLEEKVVDLGMDEVIILLKVSLRIQSSQMSS